MTVTQLVQILAAFVGTLGFALLFNIRGKRLVFSSLGGLFAWFLFIVINKFILNEAIVYFIVAFAVSVYAEVMARVLKTPTTAFITASLIPLIPGGSLYYTMVHAFSGDYEQFLPRALYTLQLAAALALGIIVSTTLARVINKLKVKKS